MVMLGACTAPEPPEPSPAKTPEAVLAPAALASEEELAALYRRSKTLIEESPSLAAGKRKELSGDLRKVADLARDPHLRANASLLLGSLLEEQGDRRSAVSFYRQATMLVPEEAEPHQILAMALAADGRVEEAVGAAERAVALDADDLRAWLALGELRIRAGRAEEGGRAYAAYEQRRKGLIDGLTLKRAGKYVASAADRALCARALAPARDNGTALALLYALGAEPEPSVRIAILEAMASQRLAGYRKPLEGRLRRETDVDVRQAIVLALGEIARDPVDTRPAAAPVVP